MPLHTQAKQLETNYGYEIAYAENIAIPEIETTLRQYSQDGYNLIIAHGFEWGDPAVRVGAEFPDTKYVVFTGLVNSTNVASIFPCSKRDHFCCIRGNDEPNRCNRIRWWRSLSKYHQHL